MPLIKFFFRKCVLLHNIHDRASMYNQCCLRNFFPYACRHRSLKTFQITSRTFVFAFTTRKGQYSIAVYPCLIARITGKFFIIFIFKFSKITFCKLVNNPDFRITKQNCRRLKTTLKRTDKYRCGFGYVNFPSSSLPSSHSGSSVTPI